MCVYIDNVCIQEVFLISFSQVVCWAKYETLCTQLVEEVRDIKYCVCENHTALL
jgi:hypothetical protein